MSPHLRRAALLIFLATAAAALGCGDDGSGAEAPKPIAPTLDVRNGWGPVVAIEPGGGCTFFRHSTNLVSVFGINDHSNAGVIAKAGGTLWTPTLTEPLPGLVLLSPGVTHTLAWTESGLLGWGSNAFGQLGLDSFGTVIAPTAVPLSLPVIDVHAGSDSSIAILADGSVWMWGRDVDDGLEPIPHIVPGLPKMTRILYSEWWFSCGLDTNHQAWCWGDFSELQPWVHENLPADENPCRVPEWDHAKEVSLHFRETFVTLEDGSLLARGDNRRYLHGTGDQTAHDQYVPVPVPEAVLSAGFGTLHACALGASGTVYCWGDNNFGQVGSPHTVAPVKTPSPVVGVSDAVDLALAADGACVTEGNGDVYCWGTVFNAVEGVAAWKVEFPTVLGTLNGEAP